MSGWRQLRKQEADLITEIVRDSPWAQSVLQSLSRRLVKDMNDGGMGGVRFRATDERNRRFGKEIGEVLFNDEDGVPVSAAINLDENGELFELDILKADFSALRRYPQRGELRRASGTREVARNRHTA